MLVKKVLWLFLAALFLVGCGSGEEKKVQDLEFTVVPERQVPEEAFQLTYSEPQQMYLVVGYGRQDCGGYSIQVKECYLTETSLVLDTELTGPKETAASGEEPSYPYIVLKTEARDEPVIFR